MKTLEWWFDLENGILAHTDLLQQTFVTSLAGRVATVHPPSVPVDAMAWAGTELAPPQIGFTATSQSSTPWGWLEQFSYDGSEIVAIKRFALTTEVDADAENVQEIAEQVVSATESWWAAVSGWIEIVTGQHLTHVGHHKEEVIGNPISIWLIADDGLQSESINVPATNTLRLEPLNVVDPDIFKGCTGLSDAHPPLAWSLLRDARSLKDADQYRRAVIDAATAADLAVTEHLDQQLAIHNPSGRAKIMQKTHMMGKKLEQLENLGVKYPQSFNDKLLDMRNIAVHEGASISREACTDAIAEAATAVENVFPLPTPPGATVQLTRLW